MSRYLSHLAALTLNQLEPVQPRLASRFETPVDKEPFGHNGLDVAQENRISMPHIPVQPSTVNVPDSPDHMKLMRSRMGSQFEAQVAREPPAHNRLDAAQETQVSKPHEPVQPTMVTVTDNPVVPTNVTVSTEGQAKKASNGQDQPKPVQATKFKFNQSESLGEQQKTSSSKNFSLFDKATVIPVAQSVNKPVEQAFQAAHKDIRSTENVSTLIERVQERFTESTHNELVINEVAMSAEHQTIIKPEVSTPPVLVKPVSITPRSEQSKFGSNPSSQASAQKLTADLYDIEARPAPTIQVTIGRIEIRATQVADKSVAKPRAANNTMTLDDYLKQRNGGKS
jgi:hypothetical protein